MVQNTHIAHSIYFSCGFLFSVCLSRAPYEWDPGDGETALAPGIFFMALHRYFTLASLKS
jgi:hypothetical protein